MIDLVKDTLELLARPIVACAPRYFDSPRQRLHLAPKDDFTNMVVKFHEKKEIESVIVERKTTTKINQIVEGN